MRCRNFVALPTVYEGPFKLQPEDGLMKAETCCCYYFLINLLKPTGHVMHQQFNIHQLNALPTLCVFCIYLRTNSDLCHLQHKLIGFYNPDEKCLQRGTDWVFK